MGRLSRPSAINPNEGMKMTQAAFQSELRDGMRVDWDVPIEMDDGLVLRADVQHER